MIKMKKILLLVSFMLMIISSIFFVKAYQSHTLVQIEDANGNNLNTILQGKMVKSGSAVDCVDGYLKGLDSNGGAICELPPYYVPSSINKSSVKVVHPDFGGYGGMKNKCSSNQHVCSGIELTRFDQIAGGVGDKISNQESVLVNSGVGAKSYNAQISNDCGGWTSKVSTYQGVRWYKHSNEDRYYPFTINCNSLGSNTYVAFCS